MFSNCEYYYYLYIYIKVAFDVLKTQIQKCRLKILLALMRIY